MFDGHKIIKKIYQLSWYDFNQNFNTWFTITGLHAVVVMCLFAGLTFLTADYALELWSWLPNLFFDFQIKMAYLSMQDLPLVIKIGVGLLFLFIIKSLAIIVIQNSLDLSFDCSMRGYAIHDVIFSQIGLMLLSNSVLFFALLHVIAAFSIFMMLYVTQIDFMSGFIATKFFIAGMMFIILYLLQIFHFLVMHIIEYKKGIVESYKDIYDMIAHKFVFLSKILLLQIGSALLILTAIYFGLNVVISVILPFMLWIFNFLSLAIPILFIVILSNFFYVWIYILLYAWLCLVLAHTYRQLICPPTQTPSCSGCSCK